MSAAQHEPDRADLRVGTLGRLVLDAGARFAEDEAMVDGDVRLTFAELAAQVRRVAAAFVAAGVEPGARVAVWAPNEHRWALAALGATSVGGVLVPLNTRFRGEEAAWVLRRSDARVLVTSDTFLGNDHLAMLAAEELPAGMGIVVLGDGAGDRDLAPHGARWWDELVAAGAAVDDRVLDDRIAAVSPDDPADVCFTSGTTGRPKGVVVTHAQNLRTMAAWADIVGLRRGDRYLVVNPFFHTFGYKAGLVASLLAGATVIPHKVLDVPAVLATIERERISVLPGPPTLYRSILDAPRTGHDLSSLRLAVTGAAVVPVELVEQLRADTSFTTVLTAYGLTESTGVVTMCRADDDATTIATTSGRAIPGVEVRVVSADGAVLPNGEPGEIVVRGDNVMIGYLDDPDATAAAIDADGWLHTGDIGTLDDAGNLRITDRLKDMYICGGFNVYPAEVEQVIGRLPEVAEVAVVGAPDHRLGEVGVAFVVPRAGATVEPDDLLAHCRRLLANFKVPRGVRIVDALPRNASGKVRKNELRARLGATDAVRVP